MRRAALAMLALGCGSANKTIDAGDGSPPDGGFPSVPALGAQLDRMGRPAINTMLVAVLASGTSQTAQKDAYDQATDPATWRTTLLRPNVSVERELATNLAVFDALDAGLPMTGIACGNALLYAGPPTPTSYLDAARLFADDELHVDTALPTCTIYLALEIEQASHSSLPHATCGGRTLTHDAIDAMYSVLAAGLDGLDRANELSPRLHDGASAHTDLMTGFPYLGPPH